MGIINVTRFKVAVAKPKRKKINEGIKRTTNKIVVGKVFQDEDGTFKVSVDMKNDESYPDLMILEFTERSYDIVGRTNVFSRTVDSKYGRTRFVRDIWKAKFHPGNQEQYVPFAPNWLVKGYIVNDNNITRFDFKDLVGLDGYETIVHDEEE